MTSQPDDPRGPSKTEPTAAPPDLSEPYQAVRAHELMLNEAASGLERAVVPPLLTLNGGAAVAFLTLLGALGEDARLSVDVAWARASIVAWVFGLLLAATAAWASASRQASVNQGYRLMREEVEHRLFPELAAVIAPEELTAEKRAQDRVDARDKAKAAAMAYKLLWLASVLVFVIGNCLAVIAVGASA